MKFSFNEAMRGVVAKFLFIALFITSAPVFADTLVAGSVYFDSVQTLNEVNKLSAQHDNEGIAKLTENGHISKQTGGEMDIVVLLSGSTPDDPAEFRFLNGPTTYWTLTRNVANLTRPIERPYQLQHVHLNLNQHQYLLNLRHLHLNLSQHQYLLNLQHLPLNITNGNIRATLLLTTITVGAFGIRSMVNGNGILLISMTYR